MRKWPEMPMPSVSEPSHTGEKFARNHEKQRVIPAA